MSTTDNHIAQPADGHAPDGDLSDVKSKEITMTDSGSDASDTSLRDKLTGLGSSAASSVKNSVSNVASDTGTWLGDRKEAAADRASEAYDALLDATTPTQRVLGLFVGSALVVTAGVVIWRRRSN